MAVDEVGEEEEEKLLVKNLEAISEELINNLLLEDDDEEKMTDAAAAEKIFDEIDDYDSNFSFDDSSCSSSAEQQPEIQEAKNMLISSFLDELFSAENNYYQQHCSSYERQDDYEADIMRYMLERERKHIVNPHYMAGQCDINARMRTILVDWMVDVHVEYCFKDETLFLAVNFVDRFLSKVSIHRSELQLIGTAALFIAAKYEEIYPPAMKEFVHMTDNSFDKKTILKTEELILKELKFDISVPTANYFLEKYASDVELDKPVYCMAQYLCFLTLLESSPFLQYLPSEIALCAVVLAAAAFEDNEHLAVDKSKLKALLEKSTDYEASLMEEADEGISEFVSNIGGGGDGLAQLLADRHEMMKQMAKLYEYAGAPERKQTAIQRKYAAGKYHSVSVSKKKVVAKN